MMVPNILTRYSEYDIILVCLISVLDPTAEIYIQNKTNFLTLLLNIFREPLLVRQTFPNIATLQTGFLKHRNTVALGLHYL